MTTVSIYITDRGKGAYMFYDTTSNTGLLAISNICSDSKYQERVSLFVISRCFVVISIVV